MSERQVDVGGLEDFEEGRIVRVQVRRAAVGVLRWQGRLFAFADRCPHMGGPMCQGRLAPRLDASFPGALESSRDDPVLGCPWHGWEFFLSSGRALADERHRLRTYHVEVRDGRVLVDAARHAEGAVVPA